MNIKLQKKLINKYNFLKRSLDGSRLPYPMFGIECGDGWYKLLDEMFYKISKLNDDTYYVTQIKEKWGNVKSIFI